MLRPRNEPPYTAETTRSEPVPFLVPAEFTSSSSAFPNQLKALVASEDYLFSIRVNRIARRLEGNTKKLAGGGGSLPARWRHRRVYP